MKHISRITRMKRIALPLALCIAVFLHLPAVLHAQGGPDRWSEKGWDAWDVIPGQVLVKYRPEKSVRIKAGLATSGITSLSLVPIEQSVEQVVKAKDPAKKFISLLPNTFVGTFDPARRAQVLTALTADPGVEYFEPNRIRIPVSGWATATPNDPSRGQQWGMDRIGAPTAWARQPAQRAAVRVAVMEYGKFDTTHRDLEDQVSAFHDHPGPVTEHATINAGIIAATGNNSTDVVGVANVEISAVRAGVDIISTAPVDSTTVVSGTSMAAPHVSGTAAAVLAIEPTFDVESIPRLLLLTAEDVGPSGWDDNFGAGVVRADRAVNAIADVYAEFSLGCLGLDGTLVRPFCNLGAAVNAVPTGGTVGLVEGQYAAPTTISKPLTLIPVGGVATIGQ